MKDLFLKEFSKSLVIIIPLYVLTVLFGAFLLKDLGFLAIFIPALIINLSVVLTIMVIENYEEKNKAYELYPQLPLKKKSVLMIKFYHIIHQGLMITGLFILLYSIYLKDKDILNTSYQFIVFSCFISIIIGSLYFLGVYAFGFTLFTKISVIIFTSLQVIVMAVPMLLKEKNISITPDMTTGYINNINLTVAACITAVIIITCFYISSVISKKVVFR
jgi:hypothetical protein